MHIPFRSLVISSVVAVLVVAAAKAETRPRYGDMLRIETRSAAFVTPGSYGADDSLSRLIFDTLTVIDARGTVQPALATTWQGDTGAKHWQFWLRQNVVWHDGVPVSAADIVQAIATANPTWHPRAAGDSVVIDTDSPEPGLPAEVALLRNAVVKRQGDGTLIGTGPYKVAANANNRIVLQANPDYWAGRGFVDAVEITTTRSVRDQALDLELGRADIIEAAVEDLRRGASSRTRVVGSKSIEVMALVFSPRRGAVQDDRVRESIALSLDRFAIQSVLLQRQGEATAALLPNWMTGYSFAFPAAQDLARARQLRTDAAVKAAVAIGYSSADPLARLIAERVVLNARDAGFAAQVVTDLATADVVVERITLRSGDPWAALTEVASEYGAQVEFEGTAWQDLFNAEHDFLAKRVVVPIVALPRAYASAVRVKNFAVKPDGTIDLRQVWLTPAERTSQPSAGATR
jgi:peptide/nickel transport system substrate-binding protein